MVPRNRRKQSNRMRHQWNKSNNRRQQKNLWPTSTRLSKILQQLLVRNKRPRKKLHYKLRQRFHNRSNLPKTRIFSLSRLKRNSNSFRIRQNHRKSKLVLFLNFKHLRLRRKLMGLTSSSKTRQRRIFLPTLHRLYGR